MGYTVGSKKVIKDDNTTQLNTLTVSTTSDYLEIAEIIPDIIGTVSSFSSAGSKSPPSPTTLSEIDKFPFSISSGTATNVGDLLNQRFYATGNNSDTDVFAVAGSFPPPTGGTSAGSQIDKFPFAISSGTATDVGDLSRTITTLGYNTSTTDGFVSGGLGDPVGRIDKFPFAITSGTSTNVGNISSRRQFISNGTQNSSDGFIAGGDQPTTPTPHSTTIDKFPFSISSGTATAISDLSIGRTNTSGAQD